MVSVPHITVWTWFVLWLQLLVRVIYASLLFAATTAFLPVRLLLAPCLDVGTIGRRKTFSSILITGASSGIGAALAESYAAAGVRLVLVARRADKLRAVAASCEAMGASVDVMEGDVTDRVAMRALILAADDKQPLDLVIANAGVQAEILGHADPLIESGPATFDVNCLGVFHTCDPAIERFRARKFGHIGEPAKA
jgi:NADP-dependent 3-hydroxy acid dehydrogenase YdfG